MSIGSVFGAISEISSSMPEMPQAGISG